MTPIWKGRIANGKIRLDRRDEFVQHLAGLEGRRIELIIERRQAKRSLSQNAFYWGCVIPIMSETLGYCDPIETHEALKQAFPVGAKLDRYLRMERLQSTRQFNEQDFARYLENIARLAAYCGVVIPAPGEVTTIAAEVWTPEEIAHG